MHSSGVSHGLSHADRTKLKVTREGAVLWRELASALGNELEPLHTVACAQVQCKLAIHCRVMRSLQARCTLREAIPQLDRA